MDQLAGAVRRCGNPVVVGLDPRWEQLPAPLTNAMLGEPQERAGAYLAFCQQIIDVVAPLVPAVKPQAAFFEELGPVGMTALGTVIRYAQDQGLLVILDGKRNDIGSTAEAYARGWLGRRDSPWGADSLTVSPYLGEDSLTPFVNVATQRSAGLFVLVKTSNPGGGLLQDLVADELCVYRHVAELVDRLSAETVGECGYGIVGAVAGATYPEQLAELRQAMPHTWFLVPGFGSQGGGAADVAGGFDEQGLGAVVNSSRGIIFAHQREEYRGKYDDSQWQRAVEEATHDMIAQLQEGTPVGQLSRKLP
ncbi:orotidine-5'-phosphate decarboxylase [Adhaeretor mobilis]|uniref:Orotidine 5'-phosphate decarboxylase n=1 Tax=Adhaeretor mobilis TaxID=1930276 RepID=A0A517MZI9_9BACT|nr:orotidine-5'-phosphate decarboxylase [Adhaeretor mobilis]QDT00297.1 Orotidine 5'-phosphate decarboxylase [Adhaeretor mobilis]